MSAEQIEELRQRWRTDRSSRVFLQLAEAHRRRGEAAAAVEVLQEGLEAHPTSLAGQVALGRSLLDLGEVERAAERLEAVLRRDPTQLVAYRALVDVHLRQGDGDLAGERLALYRQLNPLDPDLPRLETAVQQLQRPAPSQGVSPEETAEAEGDSAGDLAVGPPVAAAVAVEGSEDPGDSEDAQDSEEAEEAALEDTQVLERWRPSEPSPPPRFTRETLESEGEDEEPSAESAAELGGSWLGDWEEVEEAGSVEEWPEASPTPPVHGEIFPLSPLRGRDNGDAPDLAALATRRLAAPYWRSDVPSTSDSPAPSSRRATSATLGRLYREQGHEQEAEAMFAEIAARNSRPSSAAEGEPSSVAAPQAMAGRRLSAQRLLADAEGALSSKQRRRAALERYARLLREARSRVS